MSCSKTFKSEYLCTAAIAVVWDLMGCIKSTGALIEKLLCNPSILIFICITDPKGFKYIKEELHFREQRSEKDWTKSRKQINENKKNTKWLKNPDAICPVHWETSIREKGCVATTNVHVIRKQAYHSGPKGWTQSQTTIHHSRVSGSVVVNMDKQVPVRLSASKAAPLKVVCLRLVVEADSKEPLSSLEQRVEPSLEKESNKERKDYHYVISLMVRGAYLLPKTDECLHTFGEAIILSTLGPCGTKLVV